MAKTRWLKTGRVKFSSSNIDRENGIIHDVIMCQVGEAKGHNIWLEQEFVNDVVDFAIKNHKIGMKARFGHPSMSNETLGTEMGRFQNFRVDGEKAIADLHLFNAADNSPSHPGMKQWMLDMAEEDPAAIMTSIVFLPDHYYQYDKKGNRYKIKKRFSDKLGYNPDEKVYVSLKEVHFCDIVDQGAATDKLLSAELNKDKFAVIATEFLNEYPQIDEFIQENPGKIIDFVNNRKSEFEHKPDFKMKLSKARSRFLDILNLSTETPEDEMPDVTKESLDKFHAAHEKVISEKEQLGIELGNLQKQIGEMNATNEELNAKVTGAEKSRDEWKKKYEDAFNADEPGKDGTDTIEQEDDDDSEILTSVDAEVAGWEKK